MPIESPVATDDPLMIAWEAYKATPEFANTYKWALSPQRAEDVMGSLWAAFSTGFAGSARVVEMQNTEERPEDAARRMARQIQELRDLIARRDGIIRGLREEITELKAGVTSQVENLCECADGTCTGDGPTGSICRVRDEPIQGSTPKMVMQDDLRDRVERLAAWQSKLIFPTNNKNDADRLLQEVIMEAARLSEALLAAFPLDSVSKEHPAVTAFKAAYDKQMNEPSGVLQQGEKR